MTFMTEGDGAGEILKSDKLGRAEVTQERLAGLPVTAKVELLVETLATHEHELTGAFAVVTSRTIRIRKGRLRVE